MENLEPKLKIGLIEPDGSNAKLLKASFDSQKEFVESTEVVQSKKELLQKIGDGRVNVLAINIFSYGIPSGIDTINEVLPLKEKTIPVCLLGTEAQLRDFKRVPGEWRKKFECYCKVAIDASPQDLDEEIERISMSLFRCREEKLLKNQLNLIKSNNLTDKEKIQELSRLSEKAIELSSDQGKEANREQSKSLIPGISEEALPLIISKTLEKSIESIESYKSINFVIIIFGLVLVSASLICFWITKDPAFLGFGGLGLAGMIASFITGPVSSIGKTARQMIQIQICYFGYLKQIEILRSVKEEVIEDALKKSERLEAVTNALQKSLCEHFDSAENNGNSEKESG
jgi:hypothetical protein